MNLEQHLDVLGYRPPVKPADVRRRLALFLNVVDAMRDAHARGEFPLDLQAASFVVLPDQFRGAPRVRLAAGALVPRDDPRVPLSPELVEVHRLGVLLYRLMIGRPGSGESRSAERRVDDRADVGPGLRAVMLRALAPNPEHRFANIEALGAAVRDLFDQAPSPRAAGHVALGVSLAISGLLLFAGAERLAGAFHLQRVDAFPGRAARVAGFDGAGRMQALRSLVDGSVGRLETELPAGTAVQASLLATMGNVYRSLGWNEEAEKLYARLGSARDAALAWARRDTMAHTLERLGPDPHPGDIAPAAGATLRRTDRVPEIAAAHHLMDRAAAERRAGNSIRALPIYERALGIYAATVGPDNPRAEACVREIAATVREIGDRVGADGVDRTLRDWEERR